jgi:hypothetical protein
MPIPVVNFPVASFGSSFVEGLGHGSALINNILAAKREKMLQKYLPKTLEEQLNLLRSQASKASTEAEFAPQTARETLNQLIASRNLSEVQGQVALGNLKYLPLLKELEARKLGAQISSEDANKAERWARTNKLNKESAFLSPDFTSEAFKSAADLKAAMMSGMPVSQISAITGMPEESITKYAEDSRIPINLAGYLSPKQQAEQNIDINQQVSGAQQKAPPGLSVGEWARTSGKAWEPEEKFWKDPEKEIFKTHRLAGEALDTIEKMKGFLPEMKGKYMGPVVGKLPDVRESSKYYDALSKDLMLSLAALQPTKGAVTNIAWGNIAGAKPGTSQTKESNLKLLNSYKERLELIKKQGEFMQEKHKQHVPFSDAATQWNKQYESYLGNKNKDNASPAKKSEEGMVRVMAPNGSVGVVPKDKLDSFIKHGAKRI